MARKIIKRVGGIVRTVITNIPPLRTLFTEMTTPWNEQTKTWSEI